MPVKMVGRLRGRNILTFLCHENQIDFLARVDTPTTHNEDELFGLSRG